jgi:DNA invertase Pin-like site-specific DNA recombinase
MSEKTIMAYSYIRFSTKRQTWGDSLRRQAELTAAYCERMKWTLSPATYRDLGVSARRGKNALVGNLAEFLKAVEAGSVKPGAALIVENLDRITRQGIDEGVDLIKSILRADIILVTLAPERSFNRESLNSLKDMIEIQLILARAAEESERKSERVGAAWAEKRRRARAGELQRPTAAMGDGSRCLTRELPEWLQWKDGAIVTVPERVAVVRRMFELSAAGYGAPRIVKVLTAEGVPCWSGPRWLKTYAAKIIRDRRALGEYQPRKHGAADGPPVAGYYPAVVTEEEWAAANAARLVRKRLPGRTGKFIHLFAGLLHNARTPGDKYIASIRMSGHRKGVKGKPMRVLVTSSYSQGSGHAHSFPLVPFEAAVCSVLREVDPAELFPPARDREPSEAERLEAQLLGKRNRIALLTEELEDGEVKAVVSKLRQLEAEAADLEQQLAEARMREVHPPARSLEEAKTILEALDGAEDPTDALLRLRAVIRRILTGIWVLVVGKGRDRIAEVLIEFAPGERVALRSFAVICRPPVVNAHGTVRPAVNAVVNSLAVTTDRPIDSAGEAAVIAGEANFLWDIRRPDQAAERLQQMEAWPADIVDRVLEWLTSR